MTNSIGGEERNHLRRRDKCIDVAMVRLIDARAEKIEIYVPQVRTRGFLRAGVEEDRCQV